jgi:hypothetical protein
MLHQSLISSLALLLALFPTTVNAAALYNPFVACKNITAEGESFKVCATFSAFTPSPAQFENGTVVYLGGWSDHFTIYTSAAEGFTEGEEGFPTQAATNITVLVDRDDNNVCNITVTTANGTSSLCKSCSFCGDETLMPSYSADCTNIWNGRMVECETTETVFFPLTKAAMPGAVAKKGFTKNDKLRRRRRRRRRQRRPPQL